MGFYDLLALAIAAVCIAGFLSRKKIWQWFSAPRMAAPPQPIEQPTGTPRKKRDRLGRFVAFSEEQLETLGVIGEALEQHDKVTEKALEVRKKFAKQEGG
jgi:hypothetical protein